VIALDDLGSELDREHQRLVLTRLRACGAQVLITGNEAPAVPALLADAGLFHVEHGELRTGTQANGSGSADNARSDA
jgi:DNA replication and repair protein RecF